MRIKRLMLRNGYKRFKDLTIDLGNSPAKIIALVGPNGCGKSSVLDGILYAQTSHWRVGNTPHRAAGYHSIEQDPNYNTNNIIV
jgi:DNA repair exonuclease SbcCD ATPase subunit